MDFKLEAVKPNSFNSNSDRLNNYFSYDIIILIAFIVFIPFNLDLSLMIKLNIAFAPFNY